MIYREHIEWCDIWVSGASENSQPRVLLIGDSITRSYYPHVQKQLGERYACARITSSKCVTDPLFTKELALVLDEYQFSHIHFNNGLHGWDYDERSYASSLAKAFDMLIAHGGKEKLTWGSTTPVWMKNQTGTLDKKTERVRERNRIAANLAADRGVCINDLFSTVIERPELFCGDGVHFLEDGQVVLGKCVTDTILKRADSGTEPEA